MELTRTKIFLFSVFIVFVSCTTDEKAANATINGKALYHMGREYNKPLLRLIGKALMELECRSHTCSEWTDWSACDVFIGQFGMKKRTRLCGGDGNNGCRSDTEPKSEIETVVCQEFCPSDYEMTQEGFCLNFYNTTKQTKLAAETSCGKDGGHLININSQRKWVAFASLMEKYNYNIAVHIDGERKDPNSPWTFTYETDKSGYTNWGDNDPDNGSSDLCMIAQKSSSEGLFDNSCTVNRYYVCEIVPAN